MPRIKLVHHVNWDAMLSHLDELGIKHVRASTASVSANLGGTLPNRGVREDTREHYPAVGSAASTS